MAKLKSLIFLVLWFPLTLFSQQKIITVQRIDLTDLPEIHYYLTVTDEAGNSILGLTDNEIEITINGIPQEIFSLKSAIEGGEYLAVALLFDRSGSVKNAFDQAKEAAIDFVKRMSIDDIIAVISFDDLVRVDSHFTKERAITEKAIKNLTIGKDTALHDAIDMALNLFQNVATKRQAIIILSDGKDTKSKLNGDMVLLDAKNRGVPLYTIGIGAKIDENTLIKMSSDTGGHFFKAAKPEELLLLYQTIAEQLNNQYLISVISGLDQLEHWHNLKISLKGPAGKEYAVEREYIASKGPGVKPDIISDLKKKKERESIILWAGIGAILGFLIGGILILIIRLIRPEIPLLSLLVVGLIISTMILGAILGVLLRIIG